MLSASSSRAGPNSRSRSVAIQPGSSPFTRMPLGPSSPARVLANPARPGRSPFEIASPGIGTRTDEDSTNASAPPSGSSAASARLSRTAPRKTLPNAACQASSGTSVAEPGGGPPTLISAPSSRPNCPRAVAIRRAGVAGSVLSAASPTACPAPSACAAPAAAPASRPLTTTRAPSATRACRGGVAEAAAAAGHQVDPIPQAQIHVRLLPVRQAP